MGVLVVLVDVKFMGKIGVLFGFVGFGVMYLFNGLYDVKMDYVFVLVFVG